MQDSTAQAAAPDSTPWSEVIDLFRVDPGVLVAKAIEVAGIVILAWLGLRVARRLMRRFERRVAEEPGRTVEASVQRAQTVAQLTNSVLTAAIWIAASLLLLNLFVPIGPLLAGVSIFGLALSFGSQSLVKDLISGFFILTENQVAVGDVVEIDGTSGVVERMTLRVVMLRDVEGVLHVIPNGAITKVSNKTRGWSRALLDVGVAYREDVDRVITVLRDVVEEMHEDRVWGPRLVGQAEVLGVQNLANSAVEIRVVADTRPGRQWEVRRELLRRIKNRFDREGIEIPFPQRTVHLREPA